MSDDVNLSRVVPGTTTAQTHACETPRYDGHPQIPVTSYLTSFISYVQPVPLILSESQMTGRGYRGLNCAQFEHGLFEFGCQPSTRFLQYSVGSITWHKWPLYGDETAPQIMD